MTEDDKIKIAFWLFNEIIFITTTIQVLYLICFNFRFYFVIIITEGNLLKLRNDTYFWFLIMIIFFKLIKFKIYLFICHLILEYLIHIVLYDMVVHIMV